MNIPAKKIESRIFLIRGQKVVLAADLAVLYGVPTLRLNEQVKRNRHRFPQDFVFQLTVEEDRVLTSQFAMSKKSRGGRRVPPYAFTKHGAIMAAMVLNSPRAVQMSVQVVRAFVRFRRMLAPHAELARKLNELEKRLEGHDQAIHNLFETIRQLLEPPEPSKRRIGFHGDTQGSLRSQSAISKGKNL